MNRPRLRLATPARMAAALLVVVFVAQLAVMLTLHELLDIDRQPRWIELLLDAGALTLLVSLFVVLGLVRPLQIALQRERSKARIVLDHASEGIITIDQRGTILAFNRAAEELFGFAAAEAVGRNISLIVPGPDKDRHDGYLRRYLETNHGRVVNTRRRVHAQRRDGTVFPVEMSMSEVKVPDGRLFTAIIQDVTERQAMEARIQYLAYHDPLTGLANRALYYDRLTHALALAHRERRKVGLLVLDLDGFKPINDRYGHQAGDELLCRIADRLRNFVRESDTVARLGGDEFTIVLSSITDRRDAEEGARRVAALVEAPCALAQGAATLGASIGLAVFPDDARDPDELGRIADERMYAAKARRKAAWIAHVDAPG